ncbi:hypothetical protein D3C76_798740 [compost metagenome]
MIGCDPGAGFDKLFEQKDQLCGNKKSFTGLFRFCRSFLTLAGEVMRQRYTSKSSSNRRNSRDNLWCQTGAVLHHLHAFGRNKPVSHNCSLTE